MTDTNDALTVARWCWPDEPHNPGFRLLADKTFALSVFDPEEWEGSERSQFGVRSAESVVIERGLAVQYGATLLAALDGADLYSGGGRYDLDGYWLARLATAPIGARLRALAAVIRRFGKEEDGCAP